MRFLPAVVALALCGALARPAAAAPVACGEPRKMEDGWHIASDPAASGFVPRALCEAVGAFQSSPRNLHALVVERHGKLVAEAYRAGTDRSTYTIVATPVQFDPSSLHDVRSITKSVVGLLWGIADGEGVVPSIATPVLDLLPTLADLRNGGRERITIRDLACMRSGLAWDESGGYGRWGNDERGLLWRGDRARYVFDRPMNAAPGQRFNYNGGLTTVLGLLLKERTGVDLQAYAARKLFAPLGVDRWEWVRDVRGRTRAYTGLRLRPRDLARIGRLMLDGGRWKGRQVVPEAWVRAALAPCVAGGEYGYQWWSGSVWVRGSRIDWQGAIGNGGQALYIVPSLDLVVVTAAGEYNDGSIGRAQRYLLEQVAAATREHGRGDEIAPVPAAQSTPPVETRATLVSITEDGDRVFVHLKIAPRSKLPFTTLRFKARDRALLAGLQVGASVKFRAASVDGENTLLGIRAVPACKRFAACD